MPAVGYVGLPSTTGITRPDVVSPTSRVAVNAPSVFVPVVDSCPRDVPLTVRCVLPEANPPTVRSLEFETTDTALSRRVTVPVAFVCTLIVFVVLSGADCTDPSAFLNENDRVIVSPWLVTAGHVTRPLAIESVQSLLRFPIPNGP